MLNIYSDRGSGGTCTTTKCTFHGRAPSIRWHRARRTQTRHRLRARAGGGEGARAALLLRLQRGKHLRRQIGVGWQEPWGSCTWLICPAPCNPTHLQPVWPPHQPRELPTCTGSRHQSPVRAVGPSAPGQPRSRDALAGTDSVTVRRGAQRCPHPPASGRDPSLSFPGPAPCHLPPLRSPLHAQLGASTAAAPFCGAGSSPPARPQLPPPRWGGCPLTQLPHTAEPARRGEGRSVHLPRESLYPPPQACSSPAPHKSGGPFLRINPSAPEGPHPQAPHAPSPYSAH